VTDCTADCPTPPSAAGPLEPYGIRVMVRPLAGDFEPQEFLVTFLQDLAAACMASGASIIGHLKCLLHTPGRAVACNLTSLREGARCSAPTPVTLKPGQEARLDLAVLVYGLPAAKIDDLVRSALSRLLGSRDVSWSILAAEKGRETG
jgi:hypothetical protein